jgi:hypothetical protein
MRLDELRHKVEQLLGEGLPCRIIGVTIWGAVTTPTRVMRFPREPMRFPREPMGFPREPKRFRREIVRFPRLAEWLCRAARNGIAWECVSRTYTTWKYDSGFR